jgi:O-methyltransferase involved in polyketide biosynthesis
MPKIDVTALTEAQATLLMPLWARAQESHHPAALLHDEKAVSTVADLDFPFHRFEAKSVRAVDDCLRASVFDRLVAEYPVNHPDDRIVELGVGLDTRSDRICNGQAHRIGLDLPEVIRLPNQFIPDGDRRRTIGKSLLDPDWFDEVRQHCGDNVLFTLEGVLRFFAETEIRTLFTKMADRFTKMADRFPRCDVVFTAQSPWFLMVSNLRHRLPDSKLRFSLANVRRVERCDSRFHVKQYVGFGDSPSYDDGMPRLSLFRRWGRRLFSPSRHLFKVVHVSW